MVGITPLGYMPGKSLLYQLDARFKLGFLVFISLSSVKAQPLALTVSTAFVLIIFRQGGLPLTAIVGTLRYFTIFLIFVFIARSLTIPETTHGPAIYKFMGMVISKSGMVDGAIICWRLFLIALLSLSLPLTTRSWELKAAIQWYLGPIPFIPEKRISTMASLILRFIPVIFVHGASVADAQKARCIDNRKDPVYRLTRFSIPILLRTFQTADDLSLAMEARGYNENRTPFLLSASRKDWLSFFVVIILAVVLRFSPV